MNVAQIYTGSDGTATRALYAELEKLGPAGVIALNLFRAQKCSERAKAYRGRGYKQDAYARKQWSLDNLCGVLLAHAKLPWGWKQDPAQEFYPWVLYVETGFGQVSFHTDKRGRGPDFAGEWDGAKGACPSRIIRLCQSLLDWAFVDHPLPTEPIPQAEPGTGDTAGVPAPPVPG